MLLVVVDLMKTIIPNEYFLICPIFHYEFLIVQRLIVRLVLVMVAVVVVDDQGDSF